MRGFTGHFDDEAVGGIAVRHDADVDLPGVQQRSLLDVQLEVRIERPAADRRGPGVADAAQLVAEALALVVPAIEDPVARVNARERAGCDHRRRKARAFLVRPVDDLDRAFGLDAAIVERADDLETRQHADDAVVAAAVHLRVEMAADHDGRQRIVAALSPREDVADSVDADAASGLAAPGDELVAHLPVRVGKRDARETAGTPGTDLRRALHGAPVAPWLDLDQSHPARRNFQNRKPSIAAMMLITTG
jgi:hypothetical protein